MGVDEVEVEAGTLAIAVNRGLSGEILWSSLAPVSMNCTMNYLTTQSSYLKILKLLSSYRSTHS